MSKMQAIFGGIRGHSLYTPPLGADSVIVDLGANHGEFALEMSRRFGGRYYLVEGNPELQESLRATTPFRVLPYAVAPEDGPVRFNLAKNDEGSSILALPETSVYDCTLARTVEVAGKRLEAILAEVEEPRIDLLKVDIEGAEIEMLTTADAARLRGIGQITVEFHGDSVFGFGLHREVEEAIDRLETLGFVALNFSRPLRTDVLFVNLALHRLSRSRALWWQLRYDHQSHLVRRLLGRFRR
jgi:FkbM family methyltransferase